jgi:hypothetical protein
MKDPKAFTHALIDKFGFKLKGVGPITCHLGANFWQYEDGTLCSGQAITFISRMVKNYESTYGELLHELISSLE